MMEQNKLQQERWDALEYPSDYEAELPLEVQQKIERERHSGQSTVEAELRDLHYVEAPRFPYCPIKRLLDVVLSAAGLIVAAIPLAVLCVMIYVDDPGRVLFRQYRVGLHGKRFRLYKLRTMSMSTPKYMATGEVDDPDRYITRIGHVLRKLSIDELPQLFNVLKGDMSLIGPRPLISDEFEIHEMRMKFGVYNVRPGITGLAQVNGRDTVSPAEKVRWDVKYVESFGFMEDVRILLKTVINVLRSSDVVEGHQS